MAEFGKDILVKEFVLNVEHTYLNHGSFGTAPRRVLDHRLGQIHEMEVDPDIWFRYKTSPMWNENVEVVSEFFGSKPNNLVFVNNVTTGVNSVLRSLPLQKGDGILLYTWTYFSVQNTSRYVASLRDLEVLFVDIPVPLLTVQSLLDAYESMLQAHSNIKLVVLDHISSTPGVLMPLAQLITLCKSYGKLVLVDGAHAPGQVELNLEQMGVDFYVGNLHKWAYAPRGCAILWIHPDFHGVIKPVVTSNDDPISIQVNYSYQGTADDTNFYTAANAIGFYKEIGGFAVIHAYCTELAERAANHLVLRWGTKHYVLPDSMKAPYMRMVCLPEMDNYRAPPPGDKKGPSQEVVLKSLQDEMWERFKIVAVFPGINGEVWCRISINVYNELADYEKLAAAVLTIISEQKK